jgi:twinkle protein
MTRTACPVCVSNGGDYLQDNLVPFKDGSGASCFSCGYNTAQNNKWIKGQILPLPQRGFSVETCELYDYYVADRFGTKVRVCNYKDKGRIVAQKYKPKNKDQQRWSTDSPEIKPLFGQHLFEPNINISITLTEGEEDAMALSEAYRQTGKVYPVVSLTGGTSSAVKDIENHLQWLSKFRHVVLMFDNDDAGKAAIEKCIPIFETGKVKIAELPLKDANDMLMAGRKDELVAAVWNAKDRSPKHLVTVEDVLDQVIKLPTKGIDYKWKSMTDITYGLQMGEIHIIVASNGIGKTEFVKELMFDFLDKGLEIGLFSFEQTPADTLRRLVGAKLKVKLHLPGNILPEAQIKQEAMKLNHKIYLCDRAGTVSIPDLFNDIRYLAKVKSKKIFFIDNLSSLGISDSKDAANDFMRKLQTICLDLGITVFLLSHVAKDKINRTAYVSTSPKNKEAYDNMSAEDVDGMINRDGMDWENGRMPNTTNVVGESIITNLANYVWALARNKQSDDDTEKRTLKVKALKTRLDGMQSGNTFKLYYNDEGTYEEIDSGGF